MSKKNNIGLRQAYEICNMPEAERVNFISSGLPIIFESAESLINSAKLLGSFPRESEILAGHAEEECAKIFILIDLVRCPRNLLSKKCKSMIKWFYNHLARMLYAKAQQWQPETFFSLQNYIDEERKEFFLDGEYNEIIFPNWNIYGRESILYADVVRYENGNSSWNSPKLDEDFQFEHKLIPISYSTVCAIRNLGAFTRDGLLLLHHIWGETNFEGEIDLFNSKKLIRKTIDEFSENKMLSSDFNQKNYDDLLRFWQIPMYNIDFSVINVDLEDLKNKRSDMFKNISF